MENGVIDNKSPIANLKTKFLKKSKFIKQFTIYDLNHGPQGIEI